MENSVTSPQNLNTEHHVAQDSASGYLSRVTESRVSEVRRPMATAALGTITKRRGQPTHSMTVNKVVNDSER